MFSLTPPNQLTLLRILLTPIFLWFFFSDGPDDKLIALIIFFVAALTDWYDGYVARRWGYITRWGKFLDPLADKVLTSAAFIAFFKIGYAEMWMVLIIIVRDFYITGIRSIAEYQSMRFDTSSFAKTKTVIQLIVIYLFLVEIVVRHSEFLTGEFGWIFDQYVTMHMMELMMVIVTIITAWTGIAYTVSNWNIIKKLTNSFSHGTETQ